MTERENLHIRPYQNRDEKNVIQLWHKCNLVVPWNDPKLDIERKLKVNPELFLVALIEGKIIATVMGGYEGHRGWINYMAVSPEIRQKGVGRRIVEKVEAKLSKPGCPKINVQIRSSNQNAIEFYRKIGFTVDDVISMGKRLADDRKSRILQTNHQQK
jgi:ribosomal protein S18 acetylase RimI-like enzyme